jgi:hypothetical protein
MANSVLHIIGPSKSSYLLQGPNQNANHLETCTMANAVTITTQTPSTNARAGFFHGHKTRQSVLNEARSTRRFLLNIAGNPKAHWTEKRLVANGVQSYFTILRRTVRTALQDAAFHAECVAAHAADMDRARTENRSQQIARQIHCLDMADVYTPANRAEAARLQAELSAMTVAQAA